MYATCKTFTIDAKLKKCHLYDKNTTDPGVTVVERDKHTHYETRWDKKKVGFFYL